MKRRQANCLKEHLTPLHRTTALQRTVQVMTIGCTLDLSWNGIEWHGVHTLSHFGYLKFVGGVSCFETIAVEFLINNHRHFTLWLEICSLRH